MANSSPGVGKSMWCLPIVFNLSWQVPKFLVFAGTFTVCYARICRSNPANPGRSFDIGEHVMISWIEMLQMLPFGRLNKSHPKQENMQKNYGKLMIMWCLPIKLQ